MVFTPQTQLFIMAGTNRVTGTSGPNDIATLSQSAPEGPRYRDEVNNIISTLQEFFPGNNPTVFSYVRQVNSDIREKGAWGRAAVSLIYAGTSSSLMLDSVLIVTAKFIR